MIFAVATQAVNRPYVGNAGFGPIEPNKLNENAHCLYMARNFGPVPAEKVITRVRAYINGWNEVKLLSQKESDPNTLFPGQATAFMLVFGPEEAREFRSSANGLRLCVTYKYQDPKLATPFG